LIIPTPSPQDKARDLKKRITGEIRATDESLFKENKTKGIQLKRKTRRDRADT
jgi:hypothetical protein